MTRATTCQTTAEKDNLRVARRILLKPKRLLSKLMMVQVLSVVKDGGGGDDEKKGCGKKNGDEKEAELVGKSEVFVVSRRATTIALMPNSTLLGLKSGTPVCDFEDRTARVRINWSS